MKKVTYFIGVDCIGQPVYFTHYLKITSTK